MSTYQRLAPASLAAVALAAVALAVTACGPTSGSTTTPTTGASSSPAPQGTSSASAAPQANGAFPYKPGGVTYYGDDGVVETFSIPAGTYILNQQASYNPVNDPEGSDQCFFSGELDYLSGSGGPIQIGVVSPITAQVPIAGPPTTAPYPAGNYRLFIYPETTCSWTVTLLRG
jgi:hypothetical protein